MKLYLIIFLISKSFSLFNCFLVYPFLAQNSLDLFLRTVTNVEKIEDNVMQYATPGEFCVRECKENDIRVCYFKFRVRFYQILSGACSECLKGNITGCVHKRCVTADGFHRGFLSINFQLPAPTLHVCKNDILVVDVVNEAEGTSTSIHWHGIRQIGTQFNDGVPYLTQCPIPYNSQFRYIFRAADVGTHFYHSHAGNQKADGLSGALIVREPTTDSEKFKTHDYDLPQHLIFATDWMHAFSDNFLPGMAKRSALTESLLINGRGRFLNEDNEYTKMPIPVFYVQQGKKYRFRLINSATNVCPYQFQIEGHNFTIIATELSYVEPFIADTLIYLSGERYDIVINADKSIKDYWIRVREIEPCWKKTEAFAVLRYQNEEVERSQPKIEFTTNNVPTWEETYRKGILLNTQKPKVEDIPITTLKSLDTDRSLLTSKPDYSYHLFVDSPTLLNDVMYKRKNLNDYQFITSETGSNASFLATINNVTLEYPKFPLLVEQHLLNDSMFCNGHSLKDKKCLSDDNSLVCKCIHRLRVILNSNVEFVIYNLKDKISHPMHLHGHKFLVLDTGLIEDIYKRDEVNVKKDFRNEKPVFKDTVQLPFPGFVRIRFRADNPGFWLFHCHFDWHISIGMALILQVGEPSEMPKPPKNFPRCFPYSPKSFT